MVDRPEVLETVYGIADERALVDFQSYAVMTSENHDRVRDLVDAGAAGFKVFLGTDTDLTVVEPDAEWTLDRADLQSRSTGTPFHGETFTGRVSMTVVRGEVVSEDGTVVGEPGHGEVVDVGATMDAAAD